MYNTCVCSRACVSLSLPPSLSLSLSLSRSRCSNSNHFQWPTRARVGAAHDTFTLPAAAPVQNAKLASHAHLASYPHLSTRAFKAPPPQSTPTPRHAAPAQQANGEGPTDFPGSHRAYRHGRDRPTPPSKSRVALTQIPRFRRPSARRGFRRHHLVSDPEPCHQGEAHLLVLRG